MKYDCDELKNQISSYCSCKLSKQELGRWASEAYYDLIRGGYLEKGKIAVYPFLKTLSRIHIPQCEEDDIYPCEEKSVHEIAQVLTGERPFRFSLKTGIPVHAETLFKDSKALNWKNRNIWRTVYDGLKMKESFADNIARISEWNNLLEPPQLQNTILEILEIKMFHLLRSLSAPDFIGNSLNTELCLYCSKSSSPLSEEKLLEYLACYFGDRNFLLLISFHCGMPSISLIV